MYTQINCVFTMSCHMTGEVTIRRKYIKVRHADKFREFLKQIEVIPGILLCQVPIAIFQVQSESIHAE